MNPEPRAPSAAPAAARKPRRGDELVVALDGYDRRGRAVGRGVDEHGREWRVTLRGAAPGDRVRAAVLRRRGARIDAAPQEVLERGPRAAAARCAHFGTCGGCSFQDFEYAAQLDELRAGLRAELRAHGLCGPESGIDVEPVAGDPEPWRYRNKMEFSFGARRWIEPSEPPGVEAGFALGLHVAGRFDRVLDLRECAIVFAQAEGIVNDARELARARGLAPWSARAHTGLLRNLVVRKGFRTGEILVALVTAADVAGEVPAYAAELIERQPRITTLVHVVNTRPAAVALGQSERTLHGPGFIRERLLGLELAVSAGSFFQTNTAQAERLYEIVRAEAACSGRELVYDLFCGTGTIALVLASSAGRVVAVEQVAAAVADARRNLGLNGVTNVELVEGDARALLARGGERPDVCVLDPPRAGLHPKLVRELCALAPRRVVYVSCNAAAAGRDVAALTRAGWELRRVRPVDLFPHTPHVECVLTLDRAV